MGRQELISTLRVISKMRLHVHLSAGDKIKGVNQPKLIVIHAMAEYILDPEPIFATDFLRKYELSSHSLITPDGVNIRCRNDNEFAYHAKGFNIDSLGIEFLVHGEHDYASFLDAIKTHGLVGDEQYQAGLYQVREWLNIYDITEVARHSDKSPGRKLDPGSGFPWGDFIHDLGI